MGVRERPQKRRGGRREKDREAACGEMGKRGNLLWGCLSKEGSGPACVWWTVSICGAPKLPDNLAGRARTSSSLAVKIMPDSFRGQVMDRLLLLDVTWAQEPLMRQRT